MLEGLDVLYGLSAWDGLSVLNGQVGKFAYEREKELRSRKRPVLY